MALSVPKSVWLMSGLALLAVVGAIVQSRNPAPPPDAMSGIAADSCFRYGKFECCVKDD